MEPSRQNLIDSDEGGSFAEETWYLRKGSQRKPERRLLDIKPSWQTRSKVLKKSRMQSAWSETIASGQTSGDTSGIIIDIHSANLEAYEREAPGQR